MAATEKVASGSNWHVPVWTTAGEIWVQGNSRDDDCSFIVLTETKFSLRCIPVWIGTLLTGLGSKKKTHVIVFSP